MRQLVIIFTSLFVTNSIAGTTTESKSSLAGAYKDYDDMYNGGYLSEQEKKLIGVEEESKHSINHVFSTSFKNIKNSIFPQWHSFIEQQDIYNISHLDMSSYRQQHFYKLQDLGTYGTPVKLFNPTINHKIIQTDGYGSFKFYTLEDIIYDTRAPLLGFRTIYNKYSNSFDINIFFATSLSKDIHFCIRGRPLFQERLFGTIEKGTKRKQNKSTDMHVMQIPLSAYLFLSSDDSRYLLYLRISMAHRKISETGGIRNGFAGINTMFTQTNNIDNEDIVKTNDVFYQGLIYYQYRLQNFYAYIKNSIKLKYLGFDFNIEEKLEKQKDNTTQVIINDKNAHKKTIQYLFSNSNGLVYDENACCQAYKPFTTTDRFIINNLEAGVKKAFSAQVFLRGFLQINFLRRDIKNNIYDSNKKELVSNNSSSKTIVHTIEPVYGYSANLYGIKTTGKILFLKIIDTSIQPCLYFNFSAKYEKQLLNISLDIIRQQVPEIFQYYSTSSPNIRQYDHKTKDNFKNPFKIHFKTNGNISILGGRIIIKPYGNMILHTNHLFFVQTKGITNSSCEPAQNKGWLLDVYRGLFTKINITGPLFIDIDNVTNKRFELKQSKPCSWLQSDNEILNNIPFLNIYCRFYFCKDFANGSASLTTGVDILWGTQNIGDKYDPITQQFFQQDITQTKNIYRYPIINTFFNFRFGDFAFSAKLNNLLQLLGVLYQNYCNTPYYPTSAAGYTLTMQYIFID